MSSKIAQAVLQVKKSPGYLGYIELGNEIDALDAAQKNISLRVAILRNFTIEPLLPVLKGQFYLSGFHTDFYIGDFDTIAGDAMNPESGLYSHRPQVIIIAQWFELLSPSVNNNFISLSATAREDEMNRIINDLKSILTGIQKNANVPVIINNFPLPDQTTLGILDIHSAQSQKKWFEKLNNRLIELCKEIGNVYCLDLSSVFFQVGYANGYTQRQWEMAKAPLAQKLFIPLAQEYAKFLRALNGKTKKCLVLDCDGTLWGGILGEDGPEGITLGTTYPGSSYVHFQQQVLNLYNRGVLLALCSKNNEEDVLDVLENHEYMILKKHHFATWQVNWDDKAANLLRIAKSLNIGADSLVFADDNEFECDWINSQLPEIEVLHLSGEPSLFPHKLMQPGYFDSLSFSDEDKQKTEMYTSDKKRNDLLVASSSYEDYLATLGIQVQIQTVQPQDIARVSQLTQKTNQFNLTTRRYTEAAIKQFAENEQSAVYTVKASDKVADLGLIAAGIIIYEGDTAVIDSLLMSCRALGRGMETALLLYMINDAGARKIKKIRAKYIPTKKNVQTKDFYPKNNFVPVNESADAVEWELDPGQNKNVDYPQWLTINS